MIPVDTATLAKHLGIPEREVRRRAEAGELATLGRWRTGRRGRPGMWFDLDNLEARAVTTIYIAMICDRHVDPEPFPFSTPEAAIEYARSKAHENAGRPEAVVEEEPPVGNWLYYAHYSSEEDAVWVIPKEIDSASA